jgi:hypothetical protein
MSAFAVQMFLLGVVAMIVTYPVLMILHESSHLVTGMLVGLKPTHVRIGKVGRVLLRLHIGSVVWSMQAKWWTGGETRLVARQPRSRWPWLVTTASGPLGSAAIGISVWMATPNLAIRAFGVANVMMGYVNCVGGGSDGVAVLHLSRRQRCRCHQGGSVAPANV